MARFSSLAFNLVCDVCKNTKILSRVLVAALQACVLAGVVKNTSGSEETKFIASVDVTVRTLLSWFRQVKVSKKIREAALKRVSEAEKAKVSAVMEKIELNADEAEAAAKESEDGSESDVDMTFLVSIDSLCLPSSTTGKTATAEKEGAKAAKDNTDDAALHRMFDKFINSTSVLLLPVLLLLVLLLKVLFLAVLLLAVRLILVRLLPVLLLQSKGN